MRMLHSPLHWTTPGTTNWRQEDFPFLSSSQKEDGVPRSRRIIQSTTAYYILIWRPAEDQTTLSEQNTVSLPLSHFLLLCCCSISPTDPLVTASSAMISLWKKEKIPFGFCSSYCHIFFFFLSTAVCVTHRRERLHVWSELFISSQLGTRKCFSVKRYFQEWAFWSMKCDCQITKFYLIFPVSSQALVLGLVSMLDCFPSVTKYHFLLFEIISK